MEFATGNSVITDIGGGVEHVDLCGDTSDRADLLLVAPCTANTISKMALGIDDTPVTTMATTAVGTGMPVLVAPAMHGSMLRHPAVQENLEALRKMGVETIGPHLTEGKAKIAGVDEIVARTIRVLGKGDYRGRRVLVIGGSSYEPVDGMRIITNLGTGETAVQLAIAAFERGADVDLWMGRHSTELPGYIGTREFGRVNDLLDMVKEIDHDMVMVPAALSDYAPDTAEGKIPTDRGDLTLRLRPLPKVLAAIREKDCTLVGFKAERGIGQEKLLRRATDRLESIPLEAIVANDLTRVLRGETEVTILLRGGETTRARGSKREVADIILDQVLGVMG